MASKKQQIKNNKFTLRGNVARLIVIPFILFAFWVVASFLYSTSKASPTILIHEHTKKEIVEGNAGELLKGEKIVGEFIAKEDNLGIVAVRFNTFLRINDDVVEFRIKEKGKRDWYYENTYTTPQFQPNQHFTFGLPIIADSLGKMYQFEVESTLGEPENAVALSPIEPVYVTKYQYSKEQIVANTNYLSTFVQRKIINTFSNVDFLLSFFTYSLPLVLYLVWLFFFEKYLYNKYYLALIPIGLMVLLSILNPANNDAIVLGLTGLWMAILYAYQLKTSLSFIIALILISISAILYYLPFEDVSRNFSMWALMLLFVGVLMQISEFRWERNTQIGFEVFHLKAKQKNSSAKT